MIHYSATGEIQIIKNGKSEHNCQKKPRIIEGMADHNEATESATTISNATASATENNSSTNEASVSATEITSSATENNSSTNEASASATEVTASSTEVKENSQATSVESSVESTQVTKKVKTLDISGNMRIRGKFYADKFGDVIVSKNSKICIGNVCLDQDTLAKMIKNTTINE